MKISNTIAYTLKNSPNEDDYVIGTDSETSNKKTKNFQLAAIRNYVVSTLAPEVGGVIGITEIEPETEGTSPATVANALSPAYSVGAYELVFLNLNGHQYLLKLPNITIGVGGETLTDADFVDFPVSVGPAGNGIASTSYNGSTGVLTFTFTNSTTYSTGDLRGPAGENGEDGTDGDDGLNADMTRTSTTSNSIGNGNKTFSYTSSSNLGWLSGTRLRASHSSSQYVEGVVSSVSATSVTIAVDNHVGSGTYTSWNIGISGDKGDVADSENLQRVLTYPGGFVSGNYDLQSADNNYTLIIDNGANNVTITVGTSLPSKFICAFIQKGSGNVTFVASGIVINTPIGLKIKGENYSVALEQEDANDIFYLLGNTKV
jgi:hypothetical protein